MDKPSPNRTRLQRLAAPGATAPSLAAPHLLQRVLAVTVDFTGLGLNTALYLTFSTQQGEVLSVVTSSAPDATSGTCSFTLGGTLPSFTDPGTNMAVGALPDIWWDPDLPPVLSVIDFAATATISNWRVLRQWRTLDAPG